MTRQDGLPAQTGFYGIFGSTVNLLTAGNVDFSHKNKTVSSTKQGEPSGCVSDLTKLKKTKNRRRRDAQFHRCQPVVKVWS